MPNQRHPTELASAAVAISPLWSMDDVEGDAAQALRVCVTYTKKVTSVPEFVVRFSSKDRTFETVAVVGSADVTMRTVERHGKLTKQLGRQLFDKSIENASWFLVQEAIERATAHALSAGQGGAGVPDVAGAFLASFQSDFDDKK